MTRERHDIHTHKLTDETVPDSGVYFGRWEIPGVIQRLASSGVALDIIEIVADEIGADAHWLDMLRIWSMDTETQRLYLETESKAAGIDECCDLMIWPWQEAYAADDSGGQIVQWHIDNAHEPYCGPRPLKVYPPLHGVLSVTQARYCAENRIPVVAHCSPGGIEGDIDLGAHPDLWLQVLEAVPDLHLCLAHGGGCGQFVDYCNGKAGADNWTSAIVNLFARFPHVYIDTAYHEQAITHPGRYFGAENLDGMSWFLDTLNDRVLFGSDWPLISDEGVCYSECVRDLRRNLSTEDWDAISMHNPARFLYREEEEENRTIRKSRTVDNLVEKTVKNDVSF